jgi:nucleotide-binding universal stress UspA family protein
MESIMVVFSSTDISEELVDYGVNLAKKRRAKLIILDVRDKEMSERVGEITENVGFMGEKVVGLLKKEISAGRCDVIYKKLSTIGEMADKSGIPFEIVVERGPFTDSILKVAREKKVKTIVCQRRETVSGGKGSFEVIQV